ncbi:hypothetical protein ACOMHN_055658 [Nucella lapillus]
MKATTVARALVFLCLTSGAVDVVNAFMGLTGGAGGAGASGGPVVNAGGGVEPEAGGGMGMGGIDPMMVMLMAGKGDMKNMLPAMIAMGGAGGGAGGPGGLMSNPFLLSMLMTGRGGAGEMKKILPFLAMQNPQMMKNPLMLTTLMGGGGAEMSRKLIPFMAMQNPQMMQNPFLLQSIMGGGEMGGKAMLPLFMSNPQMMSNPLMLSMLARNGEMGKMMPFILGLSGAFGSANISPGGAAAAGGY